MDPIAAFDAAGARGYQEFSPDTPHVLTKNFEHDNVEAGCVIWLKSERNGTFNVQAVPDDAAPQGWVDVPAEKLKETLDTAEKWVEEFQTKFN